MRGGEWEWEQRASSVRARGVSGREGDVRGVTEGG